MPTVIKVPKPELWFRKRAIGHKNSFAKEAGCALEAGRHTGARF